MTDPSDRAMVEATYQVLCHLHESNEIVISPGAYPLGTDPVTITAANLSVHGAARLRQLVGAEPVSDPGRARSGGRVAARG